MPKKPKKKKYQSMVFKIRLRYLFMSTFIISTVVMIILVYASVFFTLKGKIKMIEKQELNKTNNTSYVITHIYKI